MVKFATQNKGHVEQAILEQFYAAGYTNEHLVDVLIVVADKVFTNYLFALTNVPIDFPVAIKI